MNQFYTGLIFIGMATIIVSLICILADWRRSKLNLRNIDQKKQELQSIIEDADLMIEELNKLSNYIIAKVEEKNDLLNQTLSKLQIEMLKYSTISGEKLILSNENTESLGENSDLFTGKPDVSKEENTTENDVLILENVLQQKSSSVAYKQAKKLYEISQKSVDKMPKHQEAQEADGNYIESSNLNPKYKKIIGLSQKGLSDIEIAKHLNMGRGEIQLILEMHR